MVKIRLIFFKGSESNRIFYHIHIMEGSLTRRPKLGVFIPASSENPKFSCIVP